MRTLSSRRFLFGLVAAAAFVAAGSVRAAAIQTYTDLVSWQAAAGTPIVLEDFQDASLAGGLGVSLAGGGLIDNGKISSSLAVFGLCIVGGTNCPATTVFSFAPGTTAFSGEWDLAPGGGGSGIQFSLLFADGTRQTIAPGITNASTTQTFNGFFGFVSDTSFTSINLGSGFNGNGELFDMDNLRFKGTGEGGGGNGSVPEPGTLALIALAMLGASAARVRRR